jgi:DNA-binding NarL/FixJ family response regulator
MSEPIRVLVVDDQPRARQSLKTLLVTCPQVIEVREAALAREAMRLIGESQPDVVLMDVQMPEMNGLQATRLVKAQWPQVKVIILTLYAEYASEARAAGADAFICKGEPAASAPRPHRPGVVLYL